MTIDTNELRNDAKTAHYGHMPLEVSGREVLELLDHLEVAESARRDDYQNWMTALDRNAELLAKLEAAEKERDKYKTAYDEWCKKSEWIQEGINNREISPKYLGWHLADIALDLLKEHKEKCDDLQVEVCKLKGLEASRCVKINGYIVDNARLAEEVERLQAKIAAMEQQEPVAWRTFDGEGGYAFRSYEGNENYKLGWDARNPNHVGWVEPLTVLPGAKGEEK